MAAEKVEISLKAAEINRTPVAKAGSQATLREHKTPVAVKAEFMRLR